MDLIIHNTVVPAVNQIETHLFCQQVDVQRFWESVKVQIESWGPVAEGRNGLFDNAVLRGIAEKHHKTVAQIVLRGLIQRHVVVIPKSVRAERIAEYFDVFDFMLDADDLDAIAGLDTGISLFLDHRDPETVRRLGSARLKL